MGTAWTANNQFPWEVTRWQGGIENVKINLTLRIYSNKWHVYAGLAILNPAAQQQIRQYATSATELFKLILEGKKEELSRRIRSAGEFVFGKQKDQELLLRDDILDKFSLSGVPLHERKPNSHLSLLAMVDCWHKCDIVPYDHIICSTPVRFFPSLVSPLLTRGHRLSGLIFHPIIGKTVIPALAWSNGVSLPPARSSR